MHKEYGDITMELLQTHVTISNKTMYIYNVIDPKILELGR